MAPEDLLHVRSLDAPASDEMDRIRREALELAGVGLLRCAPDGTLLWIDTTARRIFDLADEALATGNAPRLQDLVEAVTPADAFARCMDATEPQNQIEYAVTTVTGKFRWLCQDSYRVPDAASGGEAVQIKLRDITERKHMEQTLQDREEHFRFVSEQSLLGVLLIQDGRVVYANEAACQLSGYENDDLQRLDFDGLLQLIHPDDRDRVAQRVMRKMRGEQVTSDRDTIRIRCRDGTFKWIEHFSRAVLHHGKPADLIMEIDITDRKVAEDALRESEERFRTVAEMSPTVILLLQEGRILYANPAVCDVGGYTVEEVLGWGAYGWLEMVHPDDRGRLEAMARPMMDGERVEPTRVEFRFPHKNGSWLWLDDRMRPVRIEGRPAVLSTLTDITEQKAREASLESHVQERSRQLDAAQDELRDHHAFQAVLAAIRGVDADAKDDALWQTFLRKLVDEYGFVMAWYGRYEEAQVRPALWAGKADRYLDGLVLDIRAPESPDARCAMSQAILRNTPFGYGDLARDEGFRAWREYALELGYASNLALPFECGGRICGGVMVYAATPGAFPPSRENHLQRLVREMASQIESRERRRQAEEALIRAERMAAVGTLAGGVAHEFNNINVSVLGFSELLLLEKGLTPEMRNCLKRIRKAALRAKSITQNLLAFSSVRPQDGSGGNLVAVVHETLGLISHEIDREAIQLDLRLRPVPDVVMDPGQIGQVILNLLINARHALLSQAEKRLSIETGADDDWVWVAVRDTGCGIPAARLRQIFTPFYSTKGEHAHHDTPQAQIRGTGLGLSVSHTILANHDGDILVESIEGQGSVFTVRLPRRPVEQAGAAQPRNAPPPAPKARLLVVDDEPDTRDLLEMFLVREGHDVACTDDGEAALAAIREDRVHVVLLDLQMAKMSGATFLKRLQSVPWEDRPVCIVLTGDTTAAALPPELEQSVTETLHKPFDLDNLGALVRQAVRRWHDQHDSQP